MELNFLGAMHLRLCVFARVFFTYTKFVLITTKVPHLLKGRVRDDILEVDWNLFFRRYATVACDFSKT